MSRSARSIPSTHILVVDEIHGQRAEYFAPQTVTEALHSRVDVARAVAWAEALCFREDLPPHLLAEPWPALGVCVRHDRRSITVRWFADGDPDTAAAELHQVLAGREGEGGAV